MTVHVHVLYVGKVCLVKIDVHRFRIVTQGTAYEFSSRLSVFFRFDERVDAHVGLKGGLDAIEIVHRHPVKVFHCHPVTVVLRVEYLQSGFQVVSVASTMQSQTPEETQIVGVLLVVIGVSFQSDDGFVAFDVPR